MRGWAVGQLGSVGLREVGKLRHVGLRAATGEARAIRETGSVGERSAVHDYCSVLLECCYVDVWPVVVWVGSLRECGKWVRNAEMGKGDLFMLIVEPL